MFTANAVADFLASSRAAGLSPLTLEWYGYILGRFSDAYVDLPTEPEPLEVFLASCPGNHETRHGYYRTLKVFYHFIEERRAIDNPMRTVRMKSPRPKAVRTLEIADIALMLSIVRSQRDRALLSLLIDTGIRIGEAANLRPQDIGSSSIWVEGKTGGREVPISDDVHRLLEGLGKKDHVFVGPRRPLSRAALYRIVRVALAAAGVVGPKRGPHMLRHTFARQWIMAGGDIFSLQKMLGHSSMSMVRRYVNLWAGDLAAQHRRYSPLKAVAGALQLPLSAGPQVGVLARRPADLPQTPAPGLEGGHFWSSGRG